MKIYSGISYSSIPIQKAQGLNNDLEQVRIGSLPSLMYAPHNTLPYTVARILVYKPGWNPSRPLVQVYKQISPAFFFNAILQYVCE